MDKLKMFNFRKALTFNFRKVLVVLLTVIFIGSSTLFLACSSAATVKTIEVLQEPASNVIYCVGDVPSLSNGKLSVKYSDDTLTEVAMDAQGVSFHPSIFTEAGKNIEITLYYQGKSASFYVEVYETFDDAEGMTLSFNDEFHGAEVNTDRWGYQYGTNGGGTPTSSGNPSNPWGNNELQYYKAENAKVSDGVLRISAKRETTNFTYNDRDYSQSWTSARMRTSGKFSQAFGRFEAKVRIGSETEWSEEAWQGLWPAFWMMPEKSVYGGWPRSGEIDIMEIRGRQPNKIDVTPHFGTPHSYAEGKSCTLEGETATLDYHVYRVDWRPEKMEWYIDGVKVHTVEHTKWMTSAVSKAENPYAPFDEEFHILLNFAVGGNYDGGRQPSSDLNEAYMEVDYVRVWQFNEYLDAA